MMSPTPPSSTTSPSSAPGMAGPMNQDNRVVRKRNRIPLSCAPCRARKLKCNRLSPCENCIKRGDVDSCNYASPSSRRKTNTRNPNSTPDDMQNRIDRLENLVLQLVNNGPEGQGPGQGRAAVDRTLSMSSGTQSHEYTSPSNFDESLSQPGDGDSETDRVAESIGVLHFNNKQSLYFGEAHWGAVLADNPGQRKMQVISHVLSQIHEVKNHWNEHKKLYEEQMKKINENKRQAGRAGDGLMAFLFGDGSSATPLEELVALLPPRPIVDNLVRRFFNDSDYANCLLHPPSWRRTYENYWQNPVTCDPCFLGQLFAICGLTLQAFHTADNEPNEFKGRSLEMASEYRRLTGKCLQHMDTHKPTRSALETLIFHMQSDVMRSGEINVTVWMFAGIIVRLALRMGLHRDAKHYASMTPFQGEIRRRLWNYIRTVDLLFSFNNGMPFMIRGEFCDTELPRNLFNEDFDEGSESLPPSRPFSEITPMSYTVNKAGLAHLFGRVVEATEAIIAAPYDDILKLDGEIRDTYHQMPSSLQFKSITDAGNDEAKSIQQRYHMSSLFNKAICVLHRKYLKRARENPRYIPSRRSCVDAALTLLRHMEELHRESGLGGRLQHYKWYSSSITKADFLLAGAIVCLDLYMSAEAEANGNSSGDVEIWGHCRRDEMLKSIETSRAIWNELKDLHSEAFKAHNILGEMMKKIHDTRANTAARMAQRTFQYSGNQAGKAAAKNASGQQFSPPEEEKPEHSAAITLGMLSSGGMSSSSGAPSNGPYPPTPSSNGNTNMADAPPDGAGLGNMPPGFDANQFGINEASPFNMFNQQGLDFQNIDWGQFDKFVMEANKEYPAVDNNNMNIWQVGEVAPTGLEPPEPALNSNLFANNPGVFPPGTTL